MIVSVVYMVASLKILLISHYQQALSYLYMMHNNIIILFIQYKSFFWEVINFAPVLKQ